MYAENAEGEMDEAFVKCPIVQDIDLTDGTSSTTGKCVIAVSPEDTVYAEIDLRGIGGLVSWRVQRSPVASVASRGSRARAR